MASIPGESPGADLDSIRLSLAEICGDGDGASDDYRWDPAARFAGLARRLRLLLYQLEAISSPEISASAAVGTALRGVAGELKKVLPTLIACRRSCSRIHILIRCKPLAAALSGAAAAIAGWIALLDGPLAPLPDLRKKAADLQHDFVQAHLRVTENEARVYAVLQKEAEAKQSTKAVQTAILMDLARALGIDSGDHGKLEEEIRLLSIDLAGTSSAAERQILISLKRTFDSWSAEPGIACGTAGGGDFEENAELPPFKNFLCPLTREVMKEPVVLESSQTYERSAIRYWFERCLDDGRDPICPVTGQVLASLDMKPNIGLAGAIEEWVGRNVDAQIKSALQHLGERSSFSAEGVERALDNVYRISEEHPSSRYKVRNAEVVSLVMKMLEEQSERMGSSLRGKALMAMHSMAKDDESKLIMIKNGVMRLARRSLNGSWTEKEYALRLLLEFSRDESYCTGIALEKGALVQLSKLAGERECPTVSSLAEEVLKNVERVKDNVKHLAEAGRFQPLITRLCKGTEDDRVEIAELVGKMTLTNNGKDQIARQGGKVLVDMLSYEQERESSLQALFKLSTLEDNAIVFVNLGVFPALTNILFTTLQDGSSELKYLAASIVANIVSNSGHWELSFADKEGHQMQSEFVVHKLLDLLSDSSIKCQAAVLQILCGIASSPQASDLAASSIGSCNGFVTITRYFKHSESDHRIDAFRLVSLLSERLGQPLADVLSSSNQIQLLKENLLNDQCSHGEACEIVCILANLRFPCEEVKTYLGPDLLNWTVNRIKAQRSSYSVVNSRNASRMVDGPIGLLLHYARSPDPVILDLVKEHHFMTIFLEQLNSRSHSRARQRAALGLKYLSESAKVLIATADLEPQPPGGFCVPLVLIWRRAPMDSLLCPLHNVLCEDDSSFCLLKGNAIRPLVDLMNDENTEVQIAAVEALSTIVCDAQSLGRKATEELEQLGLFKSAVSLFKEVRPGVLQEKVMSLVESFFHVESLVQEYSTDQALVMALVDALKQGTDITKRHAQNALTQLRQMSGVISNASNSGHVRRTNR